MSIFTKAIEAISFDEILSFLEEGVSESSILDYKEDFPKDIAKCICAFANTFGGIIIIGVRELDGRPQHPFNGIPLTRGLQEKIVNLCVDNLYPPLVPEVGVASKNEHAFILIRVPQSMDGPHAIQSNTQAYVRTGNRNSPETLLSYEDHEWLKNRRERSLDLREKLFDFANNRRTNLTNQTHTVISGPTIEFFVSPAFPHQVLTSNPDFRTLQSKAFRRLPKILSFPDETSSLKPMDQGMYSFLNEPELNMFGYFELTQFGSSYLNRNLNWKSPATSRDNLIWMSRLVGVSVHFFDIFSNLYDYLGYHGHAYVRVKLDKILGTEFILPNTSNLVGSKNKTESFIKRELSLHPSHFASRVSRDSLLCDMLCSISWALGTAIKEQDMLSEINSVRS